MTGPEVKVDGGGQGGEMDWGAVYEIELTWSIY